MVGKNNPQSEIINRYVPLQNSEISSMILEQSAGESSDFEETCNSLQAFCPWDNWEKCCGGRIQNQISVDQLSEICKVKTDLSVQKDVNDRSYIKVSLDWNRIDIREKRVLRAFWQIAKLFFKELVKHTKLTHEMLEIWDDFIYITNSRVHNESRLMFLGQISASCIVKNYTQKLNSSEYDEASIKQIQTHGKTFKDWRNRCSRDDRRKDLPSFPIVQFGKFLYSTSPEYQKKFWEDICKHSRGKEKCVAWDHFQRAHEVEIQNVIPMICNINVHQLNQAEI